MNIIEQQNFYRDLICVGDGLRLVESKLGSTIVKIVEDDIYFDVRPSSMIFKYQVKRSNIYFINNRYCVRPCHCKPLKEYPLISTKIQNSSLYGRLSAASI